MELPQLIGSAWPGLTEEQIAGVVRFHTLLAKENEIQNLTRMISPEAFVEGHLLDVKELLGTGFLEFPAADLGSGPGVPGLLAGVLRPDAWVLIESEQRKAEFLRKSSQELGLPLVQVFADRAEKVMDRAKARSVVARAVGSVDKIYGWIRKSSTWNSLILLKGPGWDEEWKAFHHTQLGRELRITGSHSYTVGPEAKRRVIIKLSRVPRGTK